MRPASVAQNLVSLHQFQRQRRREGLGCVTPSNEPLHIGPVKPAHDPVRTREPMKICARRAGERRFNPIRQHPPVTVETVKPRPHTLRGPIAVCGTANSKPHHP